MNFTDCNCFINYKNEGNDTIPYLITDMKVQEDGTVTFTWEVSRGATIYKGNTFAILCAKKVREDGTITNEWNSRIGSFTVSKGLEPLSSITEVPEIDIISQLLLVAQQTNANAQTNINQSKSLLEKAEELGYLKEEYDVLEARMNQFTSLKEGSTTGDAELIDGRIGYDGTVYDNLGGAIRKQVSELKSDLDNIENGVILVKNLVIRHVSGYYVGGRDGKVTFNSDSSYGYVVIEVEGGKSYTLSDFGSETFSKIASADGTLLGNANDFRDNTRDGYVFIMPDNAKYLYTSAQGWTSTVDIVALDGTKDIAYENNKLHIIDYPYNKIVRVIIDKFYIPSKNNFLNDLLDDKTVNYDDIHGSKLIELRDDLSWTPFSAGSSKVTDNNNGSYTFTRLASTGGGATSQLFKSNSDETTLNIKGMSSVGNIAITLRICDEYGSTIKSVELFNGDVGTSVFEKTLTFDSAYYNVYENAKQYKIFITSEGSAGDTITFSCSIYEPNALQKTSIYNYNFADMMVNVDNALNSKETDENIEYFMMSPNGDRFVLSVDNDGSIISIPTIPSKTLFVGNSILLGLGADRGGLFGMCASNPQSDYAYHVEQAILSKNSSATFTKVHGAGYEQSTSEDEYLAWWNGTNIATNSPTKDSFTSDLDLIIIQLGDNINTNDRVNNLSNTVDTFLSNVRNNSPKARIIWVDGWFNSEKSHDAIKKICSKWKISNIYIKDLNTTENQGYSGQIITCYDNSTFTAPDTYITHPGDYGMLAIANRIIDKMNM